MTPREEIIQGIFQLPDSFVDGLILKLVRLGRSINAQSTQDLQQIINRVLIQIATQQASSIDSAPFSYDLTKDLAGCVEDGLTDLGTNLQQEEFDPTPLFFESEIRQPFNRSALYGNRA